MSSSKVENMFKKLNEDLKKLKLVIKEEEKAKKSSKESKSKKADRPKSVGACKTKAQLELFTVAELKEWLLAKKVEKITGLKKEDLIKLVLKKLKYCESSDSDSDSDSSDSDSDSSDSDSD
jgi:hypothetical protein